jgi:Putative Ig domain
MNHAHFGNRGVLQRTLLTLLLAVSLSGVSVAREEHWHHLTISGSPPTSITEGQAYAFTPSVQYSYDHTLAFAIENPPSWASFNTSTGELSGTPAVANVGTYSNIVIAVSDGHESATLPAFTLQVLAGSSGTTPPPPAPAPPPPSTPPPPTISGTPATSVVAGTAYAFQPSASGPSGLTLSFSVQNLPSWATFSIASGLISGTPSSAQTGTYSNITESVSDGQASSALPAFAVTVTAPPPPPVASTGSATVTLVPPTQNTNGTALTDLAGMTIYYGTSSSNLNQSVQVASTASTSYTISNLASGTWYFGGVAYTTTGTQSAMSAVVSTTIQ